MITFNIQLMPQRRDDRLHLEKRGTTLLFNGEVFDPSTYDEFSSHIDWIVGLPEAIENGWSVTIVLPHGWPAPRATRFPDLIEISADGPVELPPYEGLDEDQEKLRLAVAAQLSTRQNDRTTSNGREIKIPEPLILGEMPEGVYFSETASPFDRFPEFGTVVAHVIATASLLDLEMWRPAISQHGSESLLAIRTAFATLENEERKRRYVRSIAEHTGRELVWKTIKWAYEFSEPVFKIRNKFAHHIWGECSALPNALLLADPKDRLTGQAALSQLLAHQPAEQESHILMRIASGEGGSKLSEDDAKAILKMAAARQNNPSRIEAFDMAFGNPMDFRAPAAEVWTAIDFKNAALAADMARTHVVGRLQQISQWMNGLRAEDELEPLPEKLQKGRRS
ncbi:MAG: hypothetical protein MEQ84_03075 [Mesorhizobium sp.]|nr:hypothetical protein [Mesorhizobium sp.]